MPPLSFDEISTGTKLFAKAFFEAGQGTYASANVHFLDNMPSARTVRDSVSSYDVKMRQEFAD